MRGGQGLEEEQGGNGGHCTRTRELIIGTRRWMYVRWLLYTKYLTGLDSLAGLDGPASGSSTSGGVASRIRQTTLTLSSISLEISSSSVDSGILASNGVEG